MKNWHFKSQCLTDPVCLLDTCLWILWKTTLDVFSCPSGKAGTQIKSMQDKAQAWVDSAKEGGKLR
jgi:hypothetical protein